jgi:hypothetical protein
MTRFFSILFVIRVFSASHASGATWNFDPRLRRGAAIADKLNRMKELPVNMAAEH